MSAPDYIELWHKHLRGEIEGGLDNLLAEDCVFYSPIVFSPQKGKDLTKMYLIAAGGTFSEGDKEKAVGQPESKFKYSKEGDAGENARLADLPRHSPVNLGWCFSRKA